MGVLIVARDVTTIKKNWNYGHHLDERKIPKMVA